MPLLLCTQCRCIELLSSSVDLLHACMHASPNLYSRSHVSLPTYTGRMDSQLLAALRWLALAAGGEAKQVQVMAGLQWATQLVQVRVVLFVCVLAACLAGWLAS